MAVQKSRKSHSKSHMRRAHTEMRTPTLSTDPTSGEIHRRHHVTKQGYLRGQKVLNLSQDE